MGQLSRNTQKVRSVFIKMRSLYKSYNLSLDMKLKFLRCSIFSVLLYGVETWTLTKETTKRIEGAAAKNPTRQINSRRASGRRRISWLANLRTWPSNRHQQSKNSHADSQHPKRMTERT